MRHTQGFTLVEILVVISIIGVLVGLLVPAVMSARESARRTACMSNQRQLGQATLALESTQRCFPGYKNKVGSTSTTWVVPILPYIGQQNVYELWLSEALADPSEKKTLIKVLICPSNPPLANEGSPLAYIPNRGRYGNDTSPAEGVCLNHAVTPPIRVGLEYIATHDGPTTTLLLSESLSAKCWGKEGWAINDKLLAFGWDATSSNLTDFVSSHHRGGVVVTFCDGHQHFLGNAVDYDVYKQLLSPYGQGCSPSMTNVLDEDSY